MFLYISANHGILSECMGHGGNLTCKVLYIYQVCHKDYCTIVHVFRVVFYGNTFNENSHVFAIYSENVTVLIRGY